MMTSARCAKSAGRHGHLVCPWWTRGRILKRWPVSRQRAQWYPATFALALVLFCAQVGHGQDIINRREQARRMTMATPQGVYAHYCAHCHGDDAMGSGRLWPTELSPKPADLTALEQSEDYLIAAIRDGSGVHGKSNLCPPWSRTIPAADIGRLARYIVSLGGDNSEPSATPAEARGSPSEPVREPFPWLPSIILFVEIGLVVWLLRAGTGNRPPQESAPSNPAQN